MRVCVIPSDAQQTVVKYLNFIVLNFLSSYSILLCMVKYMSAVERRHYIKFLIT